VAGDSHAHQNPGLLALSVVWLRYHNALAARLQAQHPSWSDERLFHAARRRLIAVLQVCTTAVLQYVVLQCALQAPAQDPLVCSSTRQCWLQLWVSCTVVRRCCDCNVQRVRRRLQMSRFDSRLEPRRCRAECARNSGLLCSVIAFLVCSAQTF